FQALPAGPLLGGRLKIDYAPGPSFFLRIHVIDAESLDWGQESGHAFGSPRGRRDVAASSCVVRKSRRHFANRAARGTTAARWRHHGRVHAAERPAAAPAIRERSERSREGGA